MYTKHKHSLIMNLLIAAILQSQVSSTTAIENDGLLAHVWNGSYCGVQNPAYGQDMFLGMPYAQPPIGELRYRVPVSLETTWAGLRNAGDYGYACPGYTIDTEVAAFNHTNEDCLTVNVVRPTNQTTLLPVAVYIHGYGL